MVHIIKVYFTGPKQNVQIRRLAVNSDVVSRFDLLARKIREMFPGLAQGHIEVTWKDSDNDVIHMSSDEELAQALASADDDILRIYAYSLDNQQCEMRENLNFKSSHNEIHQNVICDGCDKVIHGYRYKCLQCRNFDLCSDCNAANKHDNHDMIKLMRPTHISREWVFPGARKLWRSMFGRCPYSYFTTTASPNENEQATKSDSKKNQWPGIMDDLLKGGYVSADKLIKENLGPFLKFVESVSGNLDVKLEGSPQKPSPCAEKRDNKTADNANNDSSNAKPTSSATPPHSKEVPPKEIPVKECLASMLSKTAEQLGNLAPLDKMRQREHKENITEPCGLFCNDTDNLKLNELPKEQKAVIDKVMTNIKQLVEKNDTSVVGDSSEQKQMENFAKYCGLFSDNESADGWTILNKQEVEKNATSANDNGAKPKYPNLYPSSFETIQSLETSNAGNANAETKLKEVSSIQKDDAQVLPKPDVLVKNEGDKSAGLQQNENVTASYDPEIMNALVKMQTMGFTNEGGWLERLLITKEGNINATLDALYPNSRRQ